MEKIPDTGPALIVYYHGAIPIDYYYFLANVILQKGRTCHSVGDHFLFKIPGLLFQIIKFPLSDFVGFLHSSCTASFLKVSWTGVNDAIANKGKGEGQKGACEHS